MVSPGATVIALEFFAPKEEPATGAALAQDPTVKGWKTEQLALRV